MNLLFKINVQRLPLNLPRRGFSIIEVLTSIVVAMVGVLGVMIMVPFAVQQAQTGLDSDAAIVAGRNAFDQFEVSGYRNPQNWIFLNPDTGNLEFVNPDRPQIFSIDPIAVNSNDDTANNGFNYVDTWFPYNQKNASISGFGYPVSAAYRISAANLATPLGNPMGAAEANRMFYSQDELIFDVPDAAPGVVDASLNGPAQVYDFGANPAIGLRRQSLGSISWSALVVPTRDFPTVTAAWKYQMYILLHKNRRAGLTPIPDPDPTDNYGRMLTARIDPILNTGLASPLSNVYLDDVTLKVEEGDLLRKDDWVLLINEVLNADPGFNVQLAFCRVVSYADGDGVSTKSSITLAPIDSEEFNFGNNTTHGETHIVLLQNVVSVRKEYFTPEGASNWNLSN